MNYLTNDNIKIHRPLAKQMNELTFIDYYQRLMLLARSCFKWNGLPNGIEERHIERFLFGAGRCIFFEDPLRGFMVTECITDGNVNHHDDPTCVSPTGVDIDYKRLIVGQDCILIRNNDEMIPTAFNLRLFAYRLAEISRAIDVNINAQKTPVILAGVNKELLTLKNIYSKVEQNELAIYVDKGFDLENIKVLNIEAPAVFPELQVQKQDIWNECLTFLGINNANTDKRERLVTNEVDANNIHIDLSSDCYLKTRQLAAEQINKRYGLNITVERRECPDVIDMEESEDVTEVK